MGRKYTLDRSGKNQKFKISYDKELNPQQLEAVTSPGGAALVIAGAGSGKTRTLTYRVAHLLESGVRPWEILLLTFTNKAAKEMAIRVKELLPLDISSMWSGTFHSIGNRILRQNAEALGFSPNFTILDREDQGDLITAVLSSLNFGTTAKRLPKAGVIAEIFSLAVNKSKSIPEILGEQFEYFFHVEEELQAIYKEYQKRKKAANAMDFDDLLVKPLELFRQYPSIATRYQKRFRHVLVDEYQDTNAIQAEFIHQLAKGHGNLMAVGDDAQSIYSWRGADFRNILEFSKKYPDSKIYKIETNYRSVPEVLELANAAISENALQFEKTLQAHRDSQATKPAIVRLSDSGDEAAFVAQQIVELCDQGVSLNEMAVLYRAHFHAMELQLELTQRGIPFTITSGIRFFEQAHVKDVLALMKFAINPRDEIAFKRAAQLLQGIGTRSSEKLWGEIQKRLVTAELQHQQTAAVLAQETPDAPAPAENEEQDPDWDIDDEEGAGSRTPEPRWQPGFEILLDGLVVPNKSKALWQQFSYTMQELAPAGEPVDPSSMITSILEAFYDDYLKQKYSNAETRREDLDNLAGYAEKFISTQEFLVQMALLSNLDQSEETDDVERVTLSSVHQAKGLEWKVVFVIHLGEGMFPGNRSLDNPSALEEERRLFYVACTRAMDELYLTWPEYRLNANYGDSVLRASRFLEEIPENLMEAWEIT